MPLFPYAHLIVTNRRRTREEMEYELLDTGVFNHDRYFDVFVEYAKDGPEDILVKITAVNRGPEKAELHPLPTLWFRNDWANWIAGPWPRNPLKQLKAAAGMRAIERRNIPTLGTYYLYSDGDVPLLFTENETNNGRLFPGTRMRARRSKTASMTTWCWGGKRGESGSTGNEGGSALSDDGGATRSVGTVRLRPHESGPRGDVPFGPRFDDDPRRPFARGGRLLPLRDSSLSERGRRQVMRQALAGMLWCKQFYYFNPDLWLTEHQANPLHPGEPKLTKFGVVSHGQRGILSMPDKWEYPWYAAWDLAFHTLALSIVDPDFAKQLMLLMLKGSICIRADRFPPMNGISAT